MPSPIAQLILAIIIIVFAFKLIEAQLQSAKSLKAIEEMLASVIKKDEPDKDARPAYRSNASRRECGLNCRCGRVVPHCQVHADKLVGHGWAKARLVHGDRSGNGNRNRLGDRRAHGRSHGKSVSSSRGGAHAQRRSAGDGQTAGIMSPMPLAKTAVRLVLAPAAIMVGFAVKLVMVGAGSTVTVTVCVIAVPLAGVTVRLDCGGCGADAHRFTAGDGDIAGRDDACTAGEDGRKAGAAARTDRGWIGHKTGDRGARIHGDSHRLGYCRSQGRSDGECVGCGRGGLTLTAVPLVTAILPGVITPAPPANTAVRLELPPAPIVGGVATKLVMVGADRR